MPTTTNSRRLAQWPTMTGRLRDCIGESKYKKPFEIERLLRYFAASLIRRSIVQRYEQCSQLVDGRVNSFNERLAYSGVSRLLKKVHGHSNRHPCPRSLSERPRSQSWQTDLEMALANPLLRLPGFFPHKLLVGLRQFVDGERNHRAVWFFQ